jgi:hypothetical protein
MSTENTAGRYIALFLQAQSYSGYIVLWVPRSSQAIA